MEFPFLGDHCSIDSCRILTFLPVTCDGCRKTFCKNHYQYDNHNCRSPGIKDNQVPLCPLCGTVVPIRPGELPDVRVGQHIDSDCKSKPASELKGKIFSNKCSVTTCKKREPVPFSCPKCHRNFCLSHRNELDHNCTGPVNTPYSQRLSAAGSAAIKRMTATASNSLKTQNHQQPSQPSRQQEEEDRQLAFAISESLKEADRLQQSHSNNSRSTNPNSSSNNDRQRESSNESCKLI